MKKIIEQFPFLKNSLVTVGVVNEEIKQKYHDEVRNYLLKKYMIFPIFTTKEESNILTKFNTLMSLLSTNDLNGFSNYFDDVDCPVLNIWFNLLSFTIKVKEHFLAA